MSKSLKDLKAKLAMEEEQQYEEEAEMTEEQMMEEERLKSDITEPLVMEKYKEAGRICNLVIDFVMKTASSTITVAELCQQADKMIVDLCAQYRSKDKAMEKGVAFPTCISLNHVVGHYSPVVGADNTSFKVGDLVKVDCGVHIDGLIAVGAHSFIVQSTDSTVDNIHINSSNNKIKGRVADVMAACQVAAEASLRLLRPGNKNYQVSEMFHKVSQDYHVQCVQGVLSHQLQRFNIDGEKVILNRIDPEHKVAEVEFQIGDVWAIDIVMSTSDGRPRETGDERTTIYKKLQQRNYSLKMQASRQIYNDISKQYPVFPFHCRSFDQKLLKMALRECLQHELIIPYPILQERESEFVSHMKMTVLITDKGPVRITGQNYDLNKFESQYKLDNSDVKLLLSQSIKFADASADADKKKKKKK